MSADANGWRDISTAPKDGSRIHVWGAGYDYPEVIYWEEYPEEFRAETGDDGYWRCADELLADIADVPFDELTHWQPLPAPPVTA